MEIKEVLAKLAIENIKVQKPVFEYIAPYYAKKYVIDHINGFVTYERGKLMNFYIFDGVKNYETFNTVEEFLKKYNSNKTK